MLLKCLQFINHKLIKIIALLLLLILLTNVNALNSLCGKLLVRLLIQPLVLFVMVGIGLKINGIKVILVPMIPARINVVVLYCIWIEVVLLLIINSAHKRFNYRGHSYLRLLEKFIIPFMKRNPSSIITLRYAVRMGKVVLI